VNVTDLEISRRLRAKVGDAVHDEAGQILTGQCSPDEYKRRAGVLQGLGKLNDFIDEIQQELSEN